MLLRIAVFTMMALGLLGFGTVTWLALHPALPPEAPQAAAEPLAPVHHMLLAAATPLRAGTLLRPEDLVATEVGAMPPGALADDPANRAGLMGAMLRRSLPAQDPLLAADIMRPGDHGFLAAVLTPGRRAASVAVDAVSGSAGLIWPGDRVDLILSQALEDPALPPDHRVAAETVLSDVRVLAIDQLLVHGVAPSAESLGMGRTVTLEVTRADAERVAVATRLGKLSLALRAAEGTEPGGPLHVLTTWGGDVSPALGKPVASAASGVVLRLFQGNADGKEFRF